MRTIRFICALYILCLSVYPCGDKDTCLDEQRAGIVVVDDHDHTDGEQDLCTPFCVCTCCSAQVQQPAFFTLLVPAKKFTTVESIYLPETVRSLSYAIWQPPKLS